MSTANKTGPRTGLDCGTTSASTTQGHRLCPCLSVTTMHIGGCFFGATMIGAVVYGVAGAIAGACIGLIVGTVAAFSKGR